MDKYKGTSFDCAADDTTVIAESVRSEFRELITILKRQLANIGEGDAHARSHILEAKSAAERGLKLSEMLLESFKAPESN